MKPFTKKIVLESGREFYGYGFGADREATGEIVFNTSMVGYQEILSDPSYTDQMVVMTYPLIGNYGITDEDYETKYPTIGGMIVREYNDLPSNFRYTKTLGEVCEEYGIPCVWGIDTRMLTRIIRDEGTQRVIVVDASMPQEEALRRLKEAPVRRDMVERVSCRKRWFSRTANHRFDVVAVDCGIKHNIIRTHHLDRAGRMHVAHVHVEARKHGHRLLDRIGNVVQFQIKENPVPPALDLTHDFGPFGIEKLHADLQERFAGLVLKQIEEPESLFGAAEIAGDDYVSVGHISYL